MQLFKDNPDYWPTPPLLATKMYLAVSSKYRDNILEPSAGGGNIVDAMKSNSRYRTPNVHAIEKDPNLKATLESKEIPVIHDDFLTFTPTMQYDAIVMNPPFSNGVKHVLKAWQILYDGDIVALLNAETIKNPFSRERKLLRRLIDEHGEVEYIPNAFSDAERPTNVEVALVKLKKRNHISKDYFGKLKDLDAANEEVTETYNENALALTGNEIANAVTNFQCAKELGIEAIIKRAESKYHQAMLFRGRNNDALRILNSEGGFSTADVKSQSNEFVADLKKNAWASVIKLTEFDKYVSNRVIQEFRKQQVMIEQKEFTESNIRQLLLNFVTDQDSIKYQTVLDVFDHFTKYHKENRVHIEGWKSNDYFFVGKRVVLPYFFELDYNGKTISRRYQQSDVIGDIDKAMRHVTATVANENEVPLRSALELRNNLKPGEMYDTTYFQFRGFKKGTIHLYFKDLKVLQRFNLIVGRARGWLPKEDDRVPEQFWLMNNS